MNRRVWKAFCVALCWLVLSPGHLTAAEERILYAPDIVGVERMFMIALQVPMEAPDVEVTMPDCIAMFDRTPVPAKSETRKFYFRASQPTPKAEVRFSLPSGEVVVPIEIWGFEDLRTFRKLKGVQLPRRWPLGERLPELKEKQTFATGAEAKTPMSPHDDRRPKLRSGPRQHRRSPVRPQGAGRRPWSEQWSNCGNSGRTSTPTRDIHP